MADFTLTLMTQGVVVVRVEDGKVMVLPFAGAVTVPLQPLVVRPLGFEITRFVGSVSVRVTPVRLTVSGLVTVMVSCELTFTPTLVGAKVLVTVGGLFTGKVAVGQCPCRRWSN